MKKNVWTIVLTLVLCFGLLTTPALAADAVSYVEYSWDGTSLSSATNSVTEYTEVTSETATWTGGWYVVKGDVTISGGVSVSGDVHLILTDGNSLTVTGDVSFESGNSLTVYGQAQGTGALTVTGGMANGSVGHNSTGGNGGSVTVHGGTVEVTGDMAIGGTGGNERKTGYDSGSGGSVTVNGGTVTVGGSMASGGTGTDGNPNGGGYGPNSYPRGGRGGSGGSVTVHGGTVMVGGSMAGGGSGGNGKANNEGLSARTGYEGGSGGSGGCVAVTGGSVTVTDSIACGGSGGKGGDGQHGGGSGGNGGNGGNGGSGSTVTVSSGTVTVGGSMASGGSGGKGGDGNGRSSNEGGDGGNGGNGGTVTVSGGTATVNGSLANRGDRGQRGTSGYHRGKYGSYGSYGTAVGIIYQNNNGTVYGDVTLEHDLEIPAGATLTVPAGASLTVNGNIKNNGTLRLQTKDRLTCTRITGSGANTILSMTAEQIIVPTDLVYNGTDQTEAVTNQIDLEDEVTIFDATFTYDTAAWSFASISPAEVKDAGNYTVTYKNGENTISTTFSVGKKVITNNNTSAGGFASMTYSGQAQTPVSDLVVNLGNNNTETITGVTWSAVTNVTDTTTAIVETTNFTGTVREQSTGMAALDLSTVTIEKADTLSYKGTEQTQQVTVKLGETVLTGYTVSGNTATTVKTDGNYVLTISAGENENYTGTKTFEWNIAPKPVTATAHVAELYWGDAPVIKTVTIPGVYEQDTVVVTGLTASVADATAVGNSVTFNVDSTNSVISGSGFENYNVTIADTAVGNVKVIPLTISGVKMAAETYTYGEAVGCDITNLSFAQPGGTAANAEDLVYTYTGTANDGTTWNSTDAPTKAGSYTLTVSYNDTVHYEVTPQVLNFTINKAPATVTAKNQRYHIGTKLPDSSAPELDKHYTVEGLFGEDSIGTVTMKYQKDGEDVTPDVTKTGTYDIVILVADVNSNYDITIVNGKLNYYYIPTYTPTVIDTEGGDVTISDRHPAKGQTVTITPKPDAGMMVDTVTVTDSEGNEIEVTKNSNGTYSFKQPFGSVTIQVTFKPETCPSEAFADLDPDAWYHDAVDYVLRKGLMNGIGGDKFDPNSTTSRAMIVTILWRLEGEPVVNYLMQFEDVAAETWYTEAVRWAASEQIVEGYDGQFDPMGEITREQFATILWRYAKYKGYDVSVGEDTNILSYEDAFSVSEYAIPAMQWACGAGLMQGDGVNLTPKADATRAQAAALFQRFCENVAET